MSAEEGSDMSDNEELAEQIPLHEAVQYDAFEPADESQQAGEEGQEEGEEEDLNGRIEYDANSDDDPDASMSEAERPLPQFKKRHRSGSPPPADAQKTKSKKKKKSSSSSKTGAGEDGQGGERNLSEKDLAKVAMRLRIDNALNSGRMKQKRKKRANDDEIDLEKAGDEYVQDIKSQMITAFEADNAAVAAGFSGRNKLALLPKVMATLQKSDLETAIKDENLLEAVGFWLQPLSDKTLPALTIQQQFFEILPTMDIDTETLKQSRLGRVVMFYTLHPKVTANIKKTANQLVTAWSRPILKRSVNYRDRQLASTGNSSQTHTEGGSQQKRMLPPPSRRVKVDLAKLRSQTSDSTRMRPPRAVDKSVYTIAPHQGRDGINTLSSSSSMKRSENESQKKLRKTLAATKAASKDV